MIWRGRQVAQSVERRTLEVEVWGSKQPLGTWGRISPNQPHPKGAAPTSTTPLNEWWLQIFLCGINTVSKKKKEIYHWQEWVRRPKIHLYAAKESQLWKVKTYAALGVEFFIAACVPSWSLLGTRDGGPWGLRTSWSLPQLGPFCEWKQTNITSLLVLTPRTLLTLCDNYYFKKCPDIQKM